MLVPNAIKIHTISLDYDQTDPKGKVPISAFLHDAWYDTTRVF